MSASGTVMMRVVKFVPAVENPPVVMPAPKISALAAVVVTVPLLADGAGARRRGADIKRIDRIQAAVLQGADIDVGGGGVEGDRHGVGSGRGGLDVGGVVDRLTDPATPRGGHRQLIGVARRIGHRGDIRGRVVPADRHDVGVAGRLRPGVGHPHRRLIGLRRRRLHLHKSRRSDGGRSGCGELDRRRSSVIGADNAVMSVTTLSTVWLLWAGVLLMVGVSSMSVC